MDRVRLWDRIPHPVPLQHVGCVLGEITVGSRELVCRGPPEVQLLLAVLQEGAEPPPAPPILVAHLVQRLGQLHPTALEPRRPAEHLQPPRIVPMGLHPTRNVLLGLAPLRHGRSFTQSPSPAQASLAP